MPADEPREAPRAFISYVREDQDRVARIRRHLEVAGVRIFQDTSDLLPGLLWKPQLANAIKDGSAFVALFSKYSESRLTSYMREELLVAVDVLRKRSLERPWLIPVRLDDCEIPGLTIGPDATLQDIHRLDFFDPDDVATGSKLAATIAQGTDASRRDAVGNLSSALADQADSSNSSARRSTVAGLLDLLMHGTAAEVDSARETLHELTADPSPEIKLAAAAALAASQFLTPAAGGTATETTPSLLASQTAASAGMALVQAYRTHGHLAGRLDPLGRDGKGDPSLEPEQAGLTPDAMGRVPSAVLGVSVPGETLLEVLPRLSGAYCGTVGYQIEHLSSYEQRMWLREMIETGLHREPLRDDERRALLVRLVQIFQFERFVQKAYLGQKMFSIEGLDATVPMIDELAALAKGTGAEQVMIGMAHRGRLSVLAHNLGRPIESILAEFEGANAIDVVKGTSALRYGGTGDLKYHHGAAGILETPAGPISVELLANPGHLEFIDPVVAGAARARQATMSIPIFRQEGGRVLPILLHGDAAFAGAGVMAETFNLQALEGYGVGGTIHIIQDNQVGFTTNPREGRSTPYASDMAKGFNVPIIHVNADAVEDCVGAVRLAMAFREKFSRDVVVDLIGYRRFGHSETDDPAYTQPQLVAEIRKHEPLSQLYATRLVEEGIITSDEVENIATEHRDFLRESLTDLRAKIEAGEFSGWTSFEGEGELDRSRSPETETRVSEKRLRKLNEELIKVPDSFRIHRKLRRPLRRRADVLTTGPIEFGHAEALAFASLITEGTPVRLTGQDSERGTFSNRHLVLHDEKTGLRFAPIQNLADGLAPFEIHNSPLSESSCLGFEYGYSTASPHSLVLWEAQFGDYLNAAQVIVDQFIVAGQSKWGQTTRLTLLLPHGYEGSGPEHSSARIERFLQLAAEGNMRLINPSTAAQYFHALRRQARIAKPRPMVVFTPKGILRLEAASSNLGDLTHGRFEYVIDDPRIESKVAIKRLVLCSGRLFYDIDQHDQRVTSLDVAVARVEMLYPFPRSQITELVESYPDLEQVVWCQEEPQNMGAWHAMQRRLPDCIGENIELRYVGRLERASPSEGYPAAHRSEQERIVLTALTI